MILSQYFSELGKVFLKNDILSVDIGFTNIKVVHARKKTDCSLRIINFGIGNTPPGCIKNGVIYDVEGIVGNLKKVIDEHRINERNVKIVISAGSNIISKVIIIEKHLYKGLEETIREEIARDIPVDISTQKLFYRITGEFHDDNATFCKVLVTAVPNSMLDNYVKIINRMKFKPLAIEIPFSSVARFFSKGVRISIGSRYSIAGTHTGLDKGATAVVDLGSETTNLSILNEGTLEFNRIILSGGRSMDEAIAGTLGVEREIAEKYKKMYGLENFPGTNKDIIYNVKNCIKEYLGEILRNIKRSIEFYTARCGGKIVDKLVFIGGGSALKGLRPFAEEILEIPVYTIDMLDLYNIQLENYLDSEKIRFLINAVGIAF